MRMTGCNIGSIKPVWCRIAAMLISLGVVLRKSNILLAHWQEIKGWEAYWVAKALASGNGYVFPAGEPWPADPIGNGSFHPTAWVDPLYTFSLAALISIFGDQHQLASGIFNLVLLAALFGITYLLIERLISPLAGVLGILVLALNHHLLSSVFQMNNTMLSTAFVAFSAFILVWFHEKPINSRAFVLGLVLGLTVLACPGAQLFIPITAIVLAVLVLKKGNYMISTAVVVLIVPVFIILPWTVRNYMAFGKFIPVRTGIGQISFVGLISTSGTVAPERLSSVVKPPWTADTPRSAVKQLTNSNFERVRALDRFQEDYAREIWSKEYSDMNEAQRDSLLLKEAKVFLLENPVLSAQLAIAKIEAFIRIMGPFGGLVCLFAVLGGLISINKPAILTLMLWAGAYIGPFMIVVCYYPRYRVPIEPLLVVLGMVAVFRVFEIVSRKLGTT